MWRDPLDELIDDLERVTPEARCKSGLFPIEKEQQITDTILYGSPDEVERFEADPTYQQWIRWLAEVHGRSQTD